MSFFDFNKLTARLQAVIDEDDENFSAKIFPRGRRSKLNNTYRIRPTFVTERDYDLRVPKRVKNVLQHVNRKLFAGTLVKSVVSMARAEGIDKVEKVIGYLKKKHGVDAVAADLEKLKGEAKIVIDNVLYDAEIHFYYCKNFGYFGFKVKHKTPALYF